MRSFVIVLGLLILNCTESLLGQSFTMPPTIPFHRSDDESIQELPDLNWIIEEGKQTLAPEDLLAGNFKDGKITYPDRDHNFLLEPAKAYWYHLTISNGFGSQFNKLSINFTGDNGAFLATYQEIEAFIFADSQLIDQGLSGLSVGSSIRDVGDIFYPSLVEISAPGHLPVECWIKVRIDQVRNVKMTNAIISRLYEFDKSLQGNFDRMVGGALVTMLFISLFLLFWFREKVYTWFIIFILVNIFSHILWNYHNQIISIFFSEGPGFFNKLLAFGDVLKFIITLLFGRVFINTKKFYPKTDKLLVITLSVFFLLCLRFIFFQWLTTPVIDIQGGLIWLSLIIIISILGYFIFAGNKLARFYSIGAITPFLGIVWVTITSAYGYENIKVYGGFFVGMGPVIALGLAIVYRFKVVVEEKLEIEQDQKILLEDQNSKLENKVNERTQELTRSMENLRSTQAQLIQSEKMASLGELTAGIAHEIQNPLNFVNNFSEVNAELIDEMKSELKKGNYREVEQISNEIKVNEEKILHHGKRADAIVKSMLQHSRSSSGEKEPTDINGLCKEYLRLAYHGFRAKDPMFSADIKEDLDPTLPKINVVPQDIGRVLLNILNNAFQACTEQRRSASADRSVGSVSSSPAEGETDGNLLKKPTVTVTSKKLDNLIEICVSDNGPGIPDEIKHKIFQPFFTTKPAGQGTGLGLSLSYDIMKALGGDIRVETRRGVGSAFFIQLPID